MRVLLSLLLIAALLGGTVTAASAATGSGAPAAHAAKHKRKKHKRKKRRPKPATPATPATPSAPAAPATCAGADQVPTAQTLDVAVTATECLVNQQRAAAGLPPLNPDARLRRAATLHSADMVSRDYFDHDTPDGTTVVDRLRAVGYLPTAGRWSAAENIATGTGELATPATIVDGWMHSPGHRANILDGDLKDGAVGVAPASPLGGGAGGTYTQDFGTLG